MPKFKVGDRVKPVGSNEIVDIVQHWNCHWRHKEGETDGTFYITRDIGDSFYYYSNKLGGDGPMALSDFFELVENQPMPTPEYSCIRVVPPSKPKREIVTGEVRLSGAAKIEVVGSQTSHKTVLIGIDLFFFNKDALREAAALFTTLAEVLEENENA